MALDAAHRSSIYQKLLPVLGDDDANALMSEFHSVEAQELVTKDFLRAELALTKGDLRGEMSMMRDELRGEMSGLREDMTRLETRLTLRLGAGLAAWTGLLGAVQILT